MLSRPQRFFCAVLLAFALLTGAAARAAPTLIDQALVSTHIAGLDTPAHSVRLPYHWDRLHPQASGEALFEIQLDLADLAEEAGGAHALFIARLGNKVQIDVNGHPVYRSAGASQSGAEELGNEPVYAALPAGILQSHNRIEIRIGASASRYAGLSELWVGRESELRPLYVQRHFWEVDSRRLLGVVTGVLGLFGLLLWVRLRERIYLYYGLSELLWTALTVRTLVDPSLLPWPWYQILLYQLPLLMSPPLLYKSMLRLFDAEHGWLTRVLNAQLWATLPVTMLTVLLDWSLLSRLVSTLSVLLVLVLAWLSVRQALREPRRARVVVAAIFALLVVCAIRDGYVFVLAGDSYTATSWLRFAWIALGASFVWITVERMRADGLALDTLNATLSAQLAQRNAELEAAFQRERGAEQERGAVEERQRLMRDLHDGLGSHLAGALRIAQTPQASREDIARQLREAIDQMKITVDAMQETEGDIPSMLGSVRYRLAQRLQAAGIELEWDVQRLPTMQGWRARQAYQLQMLLLEAFTNMLVHSDARTARLSARLDDGEGPDAREVRIEVSDNGRGFDVQHAHQGKGLASMRQRAQALGAHLSITSAPGHTCLCLRLPLQAEVVGAA